MLERFGLFQSKPPIVEKGPILGLSESLFGQLPAELLKQIILNLSTKTDINTLQAVHPHLKVYVQAAFQSIPKLTVNRLHSSLMRISLQINKAKLQSLLVGLTNESGILFLSLCCLAHDYLDKQVFDPRLVAVSNKSAAKNLKAKLILDVMEKKAFINAKHLQHPIIKRLSTLISSYFSGRLASRTQIFKNLLTLFPGSDDSQQYQNLVSFLEKQLTVESYDSKRPIMTWRMY